MKPIEKNDKEYFHKVIDCQYACPAHTPVPEYIRLIAEKKYAEAYKVNWISNVFPGILGRICDRPCEPACRRGRLEKEPIAICRLKRLAADQKTDIQAVLPEIPTKKNGKKIALIGGGPASLTVARDLMPLGYEVHLFDDQRKAGGFVRTQVPSFRLPEKVLDEEINLILDMGVITHLGQYINSLKLMLEQDFDAVFVGTGAPRGRDLEIKGRRAGKDNISIGIDWLATVLYRHTQAIGKQVLVLGGGNTAMDCCRTARRLGGKDIKVVVRSPRTDMKASSWEIEDALEEDIDIIDNHTPLEFVVEGGKLKGMLFDKVVAKYDSAGKRSLVSTGEEPVFIECDDVLLAVGQQNAFPWIEHDLELKRNKWGLPEVDEVTFQSSIPKLFFGGDAAFGPKNVITAVAHGHQAAISIDLFCQDKDLSKRPEPKINLYSQKMGLYDWVYDNSVSDSIRHVVPTVEPVRSLKDRLIEVELGFDKDAGDSEAGRCLNCDIHTMFEPSTCIECDGCVDACPVSCINFTENADEQELRASLAIPADVLTQSLYISEPLNTGRIMVKDENVCLHCGLCADRCPTASWEMVKFIHRSPQAGDE